MCKGGQTEQQQQQLCCLGHRLLQELETERNGLARRLERLKARGRCVVCLDASARVVFVPCAHMVSCTGCGAALAVCPVCRGAINYSFPVIRD